MRTRTQTIGSSSPLLMSGISESINGGAYYDLPDVYYYRQDVVDDSIIDDDSKGRRMKAVDHIQLQTTRSTISSTQYNNNGTIVSNVGFNAFYHVWEGNSEHYFTPASISPVWPVTDTELIRSTMDAFYNQNEVDSLLNVVEAPEMVSSTKSLYQKIIGAKNVGFLSQKRLVQFMKSNGRKELSFLSGGYLYYSFGVAPLVSDMQKISKATLSYKKAIEGVIRKAGQIVSVHRSCEGSLVFTNTGNSTPFGPRYGTVDDAGKYWKVGAIYPLTKPKRICTIRGIRNHQYNIQAFQKLDYLIGRFGSAGPASFLWERIPFSFVVDWFLDLSGIVNYLDNTLTGSTKSVKDACISEKYAALIRVDKLRQAANFTCTQDGSQIAVVELSRYRRTPIRPTISVGLSGRFGKKQLGLTAALIGQMATNLRAKR
jgi:hypothetical protein